MKYFRIFFFFIFIIYKIKSQVSFNSMSIDDFVKEINKITYNEVEYKTIIDSLINSLKKYYVYTEIAREPQINIPKVDLIKELNEINIKKTTYLDFYNNIQSIIYKAKDGHFNVIFQSIAKYFVCIPVKFYVKTQNNINYLYLNVINNTNITSLFDSKTIESLKTNMNSKIIRINNFYDPFKFFLAFPLQYFKDQHAQFSHNIENINFQKIYIPFYYENFKNLEIEFENNNIIKLDYKILSIKNQTKEFKSFYEKEIKNFKNTIFEPSLLKIFDKFLIENNLKRNLKENKINWDLNFNNLIKLKTDEKNKINIIVQNSFNLEGNATKFFGKMMEKLSENNYPIIVIEDQNGGGYVHYSLIFQKILNYNSALKKSITSFKVNPLNEKIYESQLSFNVETCAIEYIFSDKKSYIDNYGNGIKHNRTKFYTLFNTYYFVDFPIRNFKHNLNNTNRKPTDIIIFTDGFSFSTTSDFIKDLQESGNAIIVGYNGIPNEERKKDKFNGSQSPSSIIELNNSFPKDPHVKNLNKYHIIVTTSFDGSYNDDYQNKTKLPIPREYLINPIDERSNIYGRYNDDRYLEFITEAKEIFNKYKKKCNPENKNLLLKDDSCNNFEDKYARGGFECGDNGEWTKICKPYYCIDGYIFDYYTKKCKKDVCYSKFVQYVIYLVLIFIFIIAIIVGGILLCCIFCKCCECCHCCKCCKRKKNNIDIEEDFNIQIKLINEIE